MSAEFEKAMLAEMQALKDAVAFRPGWISGAVNLGRYIGRADKKGRVAKAWAAAEGLEPKLINGTPSWSLVDVDRAMRNGRAIETRKAG